MQTAPQYCLLILIPILTILLINLRYYFRQRYKHIKILLITWFFYFLWDLFNFLAALITNYYLALLSILATIPLGYSLILFFESITSEQVELFKINVITAFSIAKIFTIITPGAIFLDSSEIPYYNISFQLQIIGIGQSLFIGFNYIYYFTKILLKAPPKLKKYAGMTLLGGIFMGILEPLNSALNLTNGIPAFIILGIFLTGFSFLIEPRLAFVLPFRALRLMVIDGIGGIPILDYAWNDSTPFVGVDFFGQAFSGVSGLLIESLHSGKVQAIKFDRMIMHLGHTKTFTSILLATKSSPSLQHALLNFIERFEMKYGNLCVNSEKNFKDAGTLVEEYFPFVPSSIKN